MHNTNQHISQSEQEVQISSNSCYNLIYNNLKNRIYFKIHGFWKNYECVPDFISDWNKVLLLVKPGFTILTDMQSMITHPQEMSNIHEQAQKLVVTAGVTKVANVMPSDKIAYLQVQAIQEKTQLQASPFINFEDADQWLNTTGIASSN